MDQGEFLAGVLVPRAAARARFLTSSRVSTCRPHGHLQGRKSYRQSSRPRSRRGISGIRAISVDDGRTKHLVRHASCRQVERRSTRARHQKFCPTWGFCNSARHFRRHCRANAPTRCHRTRSAIDAPVMLMDEPFGALDALTRASLQEELVKLWQQTRKSIFFVMQQRR